MHLIYYVATGEKHRRLAECSVNSLYLSGYKGKCHVVADGDFAAAHAPADLLTVQTIAPSDEWAAKRMKANLVPSLNLAECEALLFLDCDTLIAADITPLLDRAAKNPQKFYIAYTGGKAIQSVKGITTRIPAESLAALPKAQPMVDSYANAFAPTKANLDLLKKWDQINEATAALATYKSDAIGLNIAVITSGRLPDMVFMPECERLNGQPHKGTIVEHYIHGAAARMPLEYKWRFGGKN